MAIDVLNNMGDQTDRLIDAALASYTDAAPPLGFERRVRRSCFGDCPLFLGSAFPNGPGLSPRRL